MISPTDNMHRLIDRRMEKAALVAATQHTLSLTEIAHDDAAQKVAQWNDTQIAAIASELHPETGKPLYSNAEKRNAVLFQLQAQDATYIDLDADRRLLAVSCITLRRDLALARAAADNLDDRLRWAQNLAAQPSSLPLLAELLEATTPPPADWPAGQNGFPPAEPVADTQPKAITLP